MLFKKLKEKTLPVADPPLVGYMEDAQPLSIVFTNEQSYEWIYSNYVQLVYEDPIIVNNQPLKFYKPAFTGEMWDAVIPWLVEFKLTKDMLKLFNIDIIDLIIKSIDMDKYVNLLLDEYYLPYRSEYNKIHFTHDTFIYGYSEKKQEFYGMAYTKKTHHYDKFSVKMKDLRKGFLNTNEGYEPRRTVKMISHKQGMSYEFNRKILLRYIDDYLSSFDSLSRYSEFVKNKGGRIYGISIYEPLLTYLFNSSGRTNVIPLQILLEHKQLMIDRIVYIEKNEFAYDLKDILEEYKKIYKQIRIAKLKYMKYSITYKEQLVDEIRNLLNEAKKMEIIALELFKNKLNNISEYNKPGIFYSRCGCWNEIAYEIPLNDNKIYFNLVLINNDAKGLFGFGNAKTLSGYLLPIYIGFDVRVNQLYIMDGESTKHITGINLESGGKYKFQLVLNKTDKQYSMTVSYKDKSVIINSINFRFGCEFEYINKMLLYHENSNRFKVEI